MGMTANLASNPAFSLLSLSSQYLAAETEAQRSAAFAAGKAMLAIFQGTTWGLSFVLMSVGLLVISAVMLKSNAFSKFTALLGIVANVAGICGFLPVVGLFCALLNPVLLGLWLILAGHRMMQLE